MDSYMDRTAGGSKPRVRAYRTNMDHLKEKKNSTVDPSLKSSSLKHLWVHSSVFFNLFMPLNKMGVLVYRTALRQLQQLPLCALEVSAAVPLTTERISAVKTQYKTSPISSCFEWLRGGS